jgi:chromosome segregation ATPase
VKARDDRISSLENTNTALNRKVNTLGYNLDACDREIITLEVITVALKNEKAALNQILNTREGQFAELNEATKDKVAVLENKIFISENKVTKLHNTIAGLHDQISAHDSILKTKESQHTSDVQNLQAQNEKAEQGWKALVENAEQREQALRTELEEARDEMEDMRLDMVSDLGLEALKMMVRDRDAEPETRKRKADGDGDGAGGECKKMKV